MLTTSILILGLTYAALGIPPYLKPCSRNDPEFDACALKHAKEKLPDITRGDKKRQVPSMDPLDIVSVEIVDKGLIFLVTNTTVKGFSGSILHGIHFDWDKHQMNLHFTVPRVDVIGDYDVKGKVLILPIVGSGQYNFTLLDLELKIEVPYTFLTKKGKQYVQADKPVVTVADPKRGYFHLTNLFNGDKVLGDQLNQFIDSNWRDVFNEVSPPIIQALADIIIHVVNRLMLTSPYDELFPETLLTKS